MTWRVGRFVRGMIDEDVQGNADAIDAVFDHERIAAALKRVEEESCETPSRYSPTGAQRASSGRVTGCVSPPVA